MEADLLAPFVEGVDELMSAMLGLRCDPCGTDDDMVNDVSGIIVFAGDIGGQVTMTYPMATARQLVAEMLGMEPEEIDDELLRDGVGEITNIVVGAAKARIEKTERSFQLGLPSIVIGRNHKVNLFKGSETLTQEFDTDFGIFQLHVTIMPQ